MGAALKMSDYRSRKARATGVVSSACAVLAIAGACATQKVEPDAPVKLIQAASEIPEEQLVDAGIQVFDPGLPPDGEEIPDGVFPELRKAESRYIAIHLQQTMQETGHWGAVRVIPSANDAIDLRVTGRIIESNGREISIHVLAVDTTGRVWVNRK